MSDDAKTHEPTPRRMQQARAAGQVAHSQDLASAVLLVGALALLLVAGASLIEFLAGLLKSGLSGGAWKTWIGAGGGSRPLVAQWNALLPALAQLLAPILAGTLLVAVGVHWIQTGFLFRPQRIAPDLSRTSPLSGLRRIFSGENATRSVFGILKLGILGSIAFAGLWSRREELISLAVLDPARIATQAWEICWETAAQVGAALLALGVVDYFYQRWKLACELRMTAQEMREESRELDGDPQTRARRRDFARKVVLAKPPAARTTRIQDGAL